MNNQDLGEFSESAEDMHAEALRYEQEREAWEAAGKQAQVSFRPNSGCLSFKAQRERERHDDKLRSQFPTLEEQARDYLDLD